MTSFYSEYSKYYLAVDCVIFGFDDDILKLLLIKRKFDPQKDKWSLMGGFLQEKETLDEAAKRILKDLTGLENVFLEQFRNFSEINRDPGERVVSVTYYALLKINEYDRRLTEKHGAQWVNISEIPDLIMDHSEMVQSALEYIRQKSRFEPIGFELLPDKFTIPQLQKLYEAILQHKLDNANFRKKIISMKLLKKLNEKDRSGSKRGAFYYEFNSEKYTKLTKDRFLFDI